MAEKDERAIVNYGDIALETAIAVLEEVGLPTGLLPLENVTESGYVKETGYVWIFQKKEVKHTFQKAGGGKLVSYGPEIKGYIEKGRLKSLSGVKAKEMFIWAPIGDISLDPVKPGKIWFKSFGGLGKMFPVEAFARGE